MSKLDEKVQEYAKGLKDLGVKVDMDLLHKVTKGVGPNIYKADASKVSSSDQAELDRVKKNFLMKKHGIKDEAKCDAAIAKVVETFGKSNRNKYRASFYYLLVKEFKLEKNY